VAYFLCDDHLIWASLTTNLFARQMVRQLTCPNGTVRPAVGTAPSDSTAPRLRLQVWAMRDTASAKLAQGGSRGWGRVTLERKSGRKLPRVLYDSNANQAIGEGRKHGEQ